MEVPISACPLVGLAIGHREDCPRDGRRETDLEDGEEEPRDDDDISQLGEDGEAVLRSKGSDGVANVLSQLGDHDGRQDGNTLSLPHVIASRRTKANKVRTESDTRRWLFQTCTLIAYMHTSLPVDDKDR